MNNVYRFRRIKHGQPTRFRARLPQGRRNRWFSAPWKLFAVVAMVLFGVVITADLFPRIANAGVPDFPHVGLCHSARSVNCVIDGDTIRWQGQTVRLEGIDAPEIRDFHRGSELALGNHATDRLIELMNSGPVEIVYTGGRDEDVYGRKLRLVTNGSTSLGDILVAEGLARRWDGARRGWCA